MTATLQEAIAAVRIGDTERAQLLAAEVIQDNPDDANAWYLLSQLVDSDARRAVYLSKVLTLDPSHERARAEFDALPAEASAVLPVPAPLAATITTPQVAVEVTDEAEYAATGEPEHVPDWLQPIAPEPTPSESVAVEVAPVYEPAVVAPPTPPVARPAPSPAVTAPRPATPPPPPPRQQGNGALMALLVLLVLLTLAVMAILAYLLLF